MTDVATLPHVYAFGLGASEDELCHSASLVGGKAASLAMMTSLGLRVPPGVVFAVPVVRAFAQNERSSAAALERHVDHAIARIERATGKKLGDANAPLALSVRGGAASSMPGALLTVLDVATRERAMDAVLEVARAALAASVDTAIVVQAMVDGSLDGGGSGVVITRDPETGDKRLRGEWIAHAPGRDVVGGRTVPSPIAGTRDSLEARHPDVYAELAAACAKIEARARDAQEIELTVERGTLWLLQARRAAVSSRAQVRIAVELAKDGIIDARTAVRRVTVGAIDGLVRPVALAPEALAALGVTPIGTGLPASAGTATGVVFVSADAAVSAAERGEPVILVRRDASTEDVAGMRASVGILTSSGGLTSHAAVVARALRKPCVTAATDIAVDYAKRTMVGRTRRGSEPVGVLREPVTVAEGQTITIDGSRGHVYLGSVPTEPQIELPELQTLLGWADDMRDATLLAEVSNVADVVAAVAAGAEGVVLGPGATADDALSGAAASSRLGLVTHAEGERCDDAAAVGRAIAAGAKVIRCSAALVLAARLAAARAAIGEERVGDRAERAGTDVGARGGTG